MGQVLGKEIRQGSRMGDEGEVSKQTNAAAEWTGHPPRPRLLLQPSSGNSRRALLAIYRRDNQRTTAEAEPRNIQQDVNKQTVRRLLRAE